MTKTAPIYDLTLLLDPQAEDVTRAKVLDDTRAAIAAQGELVRDDDWGERALAYPIDHRKTAEYHLLQFHTGHKELLSGLERTLHITDGVLRFRLIKLKPGVGAPPDMRATSSAPRRPEGEQRADEGERGVRASSGEPEALGAAEAQSAAETPAAPAVQPSGEQPAAEEQPAALEQAAAEEQPAAVEQAAADEQPAADAPPAAVEQAASDEQPAPVEQAAAEEQPAGIEQPAADEQPAGEPS
jgi:small subunit ribosomal protein S6